MNSTTAIILGAFPPEVRELANTARSYLSNRLENSEEYPDFPARLIGYGYGPGYKDMICTLILSRQGVKIGFYKGATLPDPHQLLTGTGKVHRYVVVASPNDLNADLDELLVTALQAYRDRMAAENS